LDIPLQRFRFMDQQIGHNQRTNINIRVLLEMIF